MIPILPLNEMKDVERLAMESGVSELDLILSAGEAIFQSVKTMVHETGDDPFDQGFLPPPMPQHDEGVPGERDEMPPSPVVTFLCGKGHNGADALAAALLTAKAGYGAVVFQLHSDAYSPETSTLRERLFAAGLPIHAIRTPVDLPVFEETDLIVDGLLGNGLRGAPEGLIASLIHGINRSGRPVLSIDVPSGVECDRGTIPGPAVRADSTLCLGALKPSAVFHPAALAFGKLGYSAIAFDESLLLGQPSRLAMYTADDALDDIPLKTWKTNKYTAGKVLVISGSLGMHGAPALCANAALRGGAGMVRVAFPAGIRSDLAPHLLEIIGTPLGDHDATHLAPGHLTAILPWIEWADAVVLGPGTGKHPDTLRFMHELLPHLLGRRVVVDGDALALFATDSDPASVAPAPAPGIGQFVLTPHAGEYRRMGGAIPEDDPLELIEGARAWAGRRGVTLVLKGATTLCVRPDGSVVLGAGGNPGMATAGSGDVLAGILGALLARLAPEEAAPLGVFLHGRSGENARRDRGTTGMTASDLILYLPLATKELEDILAQDDDED